MRQTVKWGAKGGSAVVLDPRTGAVLAMAVAPGFDANAFGATPPAKRRNRVVTDVYEPGSTFKVVTVAAALSEKVVSPTTPFTLPSSIRVADRIIHEHEPRPTQRMTVAQILSQSSNVGTITLAQMLGRSRVESWIGRFGFGEVSGRRRAGRGGGAVAVLLVGSSIGNVPIDEGIGVTPIQMAAAYGAIANRRRLPQAVPRRARRQGWRSRGPRPPRLVPDGLGSDDGHAPRRRLGGGRHRRGRRAGLHGRGQDRHRRKPVPEELLDLALRGLVRRRRPREGAAARRPRLDRRGRGACWGGVVAAPAFADIARSSLVELEVAPDG